MPVKKVKEKVTTLKPAEWYDLITSHKLDKKKEVEFVTVEVHPHHANELLKNNAGNRHVSTNLVEKYCKLMTTGKWCVNGETIKIAKSGRLLDGQHRMLAINNANMPVRLTLAIGVADSMFKTIDTGKARTAPDVLHIAGYKNVNVLAAALRYMLTLEISENFNPQYSMAPENILEAMERWPAFARMVKLSNFTNHIIPGSMSTVIYYITTHIAPRRSTEFFLGLESGADLPRKSPILQLRNIMLKYKSENLLLDKRFTMAYIINAWNAFYNKEEVKSIKWDSNQPFPKIAGCKRDKVFLKNSVPV